MLSKQENELLTRVGPGTPMGQLMRRYWHPIAAAEELAANPFRTKEVRLLGEDLVLYRDRSGRLGLVDRFCPHRRVNMAYGVAEEDGLRCQYHGWKFDHTGACIEQPFEDTVHPLGRFKEKCGIKAYAVEELAGLIFAYLGTQPAPLLPRWAPLVWDNVVRDIAITVLPSNWLQCQENSLDPVHVEWCHAYLGSYVQKIGGNWQAFGLQNFPHHKKIGFDTFEYGIIKRRVVEGSTEEDDIWKVGHPILFPNILQVGSQFGATLQFRVPMDDTTTFHVSLYTFLAAPGTHAPPQESVPCRYVPLYDEEGKWILDYTFNQDYMCWATQGPTPIAERDKEKLGESDKGLILFRRLLKEQIRVMQSGADPMNVFRDPAKNRCLEPPMERVTVGARSRPPRYIPGEAGYSADAEKIEAAQATWDLVAARPPSGGHRAGLRPPGQPNQAVHR